MNKKAQDDSDLLNIPVSLFTPPLFILQVFLSLIDDEDKLGKEYKRLHQAMEMVGFLASTKKQYVLITAEANCTSNIRKYKKDDFKNQL